MAITQSAKKAARVAKRRAVFNVRREKAMKDAVKNLRKLVSSKAGADATKALPSLYQAVDKALKRGIIQGKPEYLTKMSGIGKKTAEKIVLELRDKVIPDGTEKHLDGDEEAMEALQALGYSLSEARDTLRAVPDSVRGAQNRLREALKSMAP